MHNNEISMRVDVYTNILQLIQIYNLSLFKSIQSKLM